MEFSLGGAQELWANLLCALDPKGLSASSAASRRAAEPRGGGGSVREKREGGCAKLGRAKGETDGLSSPLLLQGIFPTQGLNPHLSCLLH